MILFINVFITNKRLVPGLYNLSDTRKHNKLDVFKYTLSSYAVIPWSKVFIYYELDDIFLESRCEIDEFIHKLFPKNLTLNHFRIDSYPQWRIALEKLNQESDEWVWFTCNDDHVFIDSDLLYLEKILSFATEKSIQFKYVAILISHWHEFIALKNRNRLLKKIESSLINGPFGEGDILEDNHLGFVSTHKTTISIQIVNKNLINFWFSSEDLLPGDLRRTDGIQNIPNDQISITPYREIVRHFDGYSHSKVSLDVVPVMMIPENFFEGKINIQYGFEERRNKFVWIHPHKKMIGDDISHADRKNNDVCDMNILLEDIPLFWKHKVNQLVREDITQELIKISYIEHKLREVCGDPRMGYFPKDGAIEHYEKIFKLKYNDLTKDELLKISSSVWTVKNYIFWAKTALPYLGSSKKIFLVTVWVFYGLSILLRNPRKILKLITIIISNPKKILGMSYLKSVMLIEGVIRDNQ